MKRDPASGFTDFFSSPVPSCFVVKSCFTSMVAFVTRNSSEACTEIWAASSSTSRKTFPSTVNLKEVFVATLTLAPGFGGRWTNETSFDAGSGVALVPAPPSCCARFWMILLQPGRRQRQRNAVASFGIMCGRRY